MKVEEEVMVDGGCAEDGLTTVVGVGGEAGVELIGGLPDGKIEEGSAMVMLGKVERLDGGADGRG